MVSRDHTEPGRHRHRDMLVSVARRLDDGDELGTIIPGVLELTVEGIGLLLGEVWSVEPADATMRLQHSASRPGVDATAAASAGAGLTVVRGVGLLGTVWKSGRAMSRAMPTALTGDEREDRLLALGVKGAVAVPIESRAEVVGLLLGYVDAEVARERATSLIDLLGQVARKLGRFIERVSAEAELGRMGELAATDSLTGLRNRREFDRMLRCLPRQPYAVLAIDIDHLKHVNDDYGHQVGDAVLHTVGTTLLRLLRGWDVVARVGGDEFAAILLGADAHGAAIVAERMRTAMHIVAVPNGRASISIGWASAPGGTDPLALSKLADECLYEAKRRGRDRVVGCEFPGDGTFRQSAPSYTELLSQLLDGRPLHAVYQPIINMHDGSVIGYEALARPQGFAPADSVEGLFDLARRAGRTRELDWICRRAALTEAAALPPGSLLFLNVSTVLLLDPLHDVDQLLLLLESVGRSPSSLVLEITERERVRDFESLASVMRVYRAAGLAFALDDVGEGHSTIELLATARAEYLKVGRSLTMTASRGRSRSAIEATQAFARTTNAVVIAEGVENEFASDQMIALGIHLGQGYGLGRPCAAGEVTDTVAEWQARAALRPLRPRSGVLANSS